MHRLTRSLRLLSLGSFSLCLLAHGQSLQPTLRQAPAGKQPDQPPRETVLPFAQEFEHTDTRVDKDGVSRTERFNEMLASDSQGRRLFSSTNLQNGLTIAHVNDPVSGVHLAWTSARREVFVVRNVPPVPGRKSCWKVGPALPALDRALITAGGFRCPPAELPQYGNCAAPSLAQQARPRPAKGGVDEKACEQALLGTKNWGEANEQIEDLGEKVMGGLLVHGCRVRSTAGNMQENWLARAGTGNQLDVSMRWVLERTHHTEDPTRGENTTTKLSLDEPDVSLFQPPNGYQENLVAIQEIPCDGTSDPTSSIR